MSERAKNLFSLPEQPRNFLSLDSGKYARFENGALPALRLGSCGHGKRGNSQVVIVGEPILSALASTIERVCGIGSKCEWSEVRTAELAPRFVRFAPGKDRDTDTLDIIETSPGRADRVFSVIGRAHIEALLAFILTNLKRSGR